MLKCKKLSVAFSLLLLTLSIVGCFNDDVMIINIGDSLTNGMQSSSVNQFTQKKSFTELLAASLTENYDVTWSNPLLDLAGARVDSSVLPYNLGVSGATVKSVVEEKTNGTNPLLTALLQPLPEQAGCELSQLDAAEYLAKLNPGKRKIITLWIGNNDVLGAVTAGGGALLTSDAIKSFLSDSQSGHDFESVKKYLSIIVDRLNKIDDAQIYIATLPDVTSVGFLFNATDIERLAAFAGAEVSALPEGSAIGFGPFFNPADPANSIARALNPLSNNDVLNAMVGYFAAQDAFVLSKEEAALVKERTEQINSFIKSLAHHKKNITVVDIYSRINEIAKHGEMVNGVTLTRSFGGGIYSLDGIHPSDTTYGLIANEFIKSINKANKTKIKTVDLASILAEDSYRDSDGDGYVAGPADLAVVPYFFAQLADGDDADRSVIAPYVNPAQKANLPLAIDDTVKLNGVKVCGNRTFFIYDETLHSGTTGAEISVRGSFNGWKRSESFLMIPSAQSGVWFLEKTNSEVAIPGNSGQPEFKFVVDSSWMNILPELPAGQRFLGNHLVIFPGDDTAVIAANEVQASTIKVLADFDLTSDADRQVLANFRQMPAATKLYRSYHPYKKSRPALDTEVPRLALVNELLAQFGVQSIITLSGNETPNADESISVYQQSIIDGGHNLFTNTDYNTVYYYSDQAAFGALIQSVVRFIIANENNAPVMVHCRLGTDRTGVTCAVLAGLCGASWDEIHVDFQKSNQMGIGEFRDYKLLQYSFEHMLKTGINSSSDMAQLLSTYFIANGYLTAEEIAALQAKLM